MKMPNVGITCYASQGGSGVVATELGLHLSRRGCEVHFISSELPFRLRKYHENIFYHPVEMPHYPVFQHSPYTLSLATAMSEVAERCGLDILHVHYAIPHAASAYLAQQMMRAGPAEGGHHPARDRHHPGGAGAVLLSHHPVPDRAERRRDRRVRVS